ncbi:ABC transporter permease [Xinfangfangia sp. CPCC 101601]|uniref:ABC transporter permease n=1 Tax=Pseudogemmobacter lacusdianii TaxID=3069608 RepID=A0ABU0VTS5_9RHOB|nr:ABC transporter permease [Xinfangfangia sp. CPCC 101601]MDQ2065118.1 ABC transporter permease [Xinfangfangia sp. CPCC 101601]
MTRSFAWVGSWLLQAYYMLFVAFLVLPIFVMILMSFKNSEFLGFPIKGLTLDWYGAALADPAILGAVATTAFVAAVSTLIALVVGTWAAVALERLQGLAKAVAFVILCIPLAAPGIISAISLRIFAFDIGLELGVPAIIMAHTVHAVPFVSLMVLARLSHLPKSQTEAAKDLGASPITAFCLITLPFLKPSLIGASLFGLLLSMDDFNRSFFLGGFEPTLPILVFERMSTGISPQINAIASIVLLVTLSMGFVGERTLRRIGARK